MNGGVFNAQTRRSPPEPSKAAQEKLLDADKHCLHALIAERHAFSSVTGLQQSLKEVSPVSGVLALDEPLHSTKRRLGDTTSDIHPLAGAKRARLEETEKLMQTTLEQPKPKRPYASFLEGYIDPVHPRPLPIVNTFVSEWLESIGSDQETSCRSDSHLHVSDDGPILRRLTRSALETAYSRDADGFAVPPTPNSYAGSATPSDVKGGTPTSTRSSGKNLVEDPHYRDLNLAANNIHMQHPCDPIPEHITSLIDYVRQGRNSPGPSLDDVKQDRDLHNLSIRGAGQPNVEDYVQSHILPNPTSLDGVSRSRRQPMARHTVPNTGSKLNVSNPVPDMLYGYDRQNAFPHQRAQLVSMGTKPVANNQHDSLLYPFFVIEFKGDGGSMLVATNQCLGGSASCVSIAEHLNRKLKQCESNTVRPVDSAAFSIAMDGSEARLYLSWKHDELDYYMANVRSFLLQDPEHFIEFRKYVRNIIDWGKDKRLNEIRDSLDTLLEENRKRASEAAKSRRSSSEGSARRSKR